MSPRTKAILLWARAFEFPWASPSVLPEVFNEDQQRDVVGGLLLFSQLIDETERSLRSMDVSEKYLRPFPRFRSLVYASLSGLENIITGHLTDVSESDLTILEFCEDEFRRHDLDWKLEDDELREILAEVNILFDEIVGAEIDATLKEIILDQLKIIQQAISEYRIRGPERLREALSSVIGNLAFARDQLQQEVGNENVDRFSKLLARFATIVEAGTKFLGLAQSVRGFLPGA